MEGEEGGWEGGGRCVNQSLTVSRFQNAHSQGWYLYLVSTRWFGMRIDFVSSIFLATVAFSSVPLAGDLNAGLVGLGLTYAVSLAGMFQYCVRLSAEVENVVSILCTCTYIVHEFIHTYVLLCVVYSV